MEISINGARILYTIENVPLLGKVNITQTVVVSWLVLLVLSAVLIWLGSGLRVDGISSKQAASEMAVSALIRFARGNMGKEFDRYIPLIGTIFATSLFSNLISVLGIWSPTADLMTELGWALVVFALITYHKVRSAGLRGYAKGFLKPIFLMAPVNILSELFTPISMACRHFGNILSGTVISGLIYGALTAASHWLLNWMTGRAVLGILLTAGGIVLFFAGKKGKKLLQIPGIFAAALGALLLLIRFVPAVARIPWLAVGIPAVTGFYFDWFGGFIQAFIFCTLTTIFIKQAAGESSAVS